MELKVNPEYKALIPELLNNLNRRHLNAFQKAELALKLIELEKTKRGRKPKEEISSESLKISTSSELSRVDTWQIVSDKLGVSRDTIEKAKVVIEKGDEKLIENT